MIVIVILILLTLNFLSSYQKNIIDVQLLINAMLIRYIYIRSSNQIRLNTEIQSSNIFESDIRPSLEGHGFFK